ncbi:MAG: hypothetical protein JWM02_1294 [Frankiales bacterium]|nr:hypothetical protein [Frankiales bacterium]
MIRLLTFALADLVAGVGLLRHARTRATRPEPAAVTGIVLLLCAAGLVALTVHGHGPISSPTPAPRPALSPHTNSPKPVPISNHHGQLEGNPGLA